MASINIFWDANLYKKLKEQNISPLFESGKLKPFVVPVGNPFSFLFTFVFSALELKQLNFALNKAIYLIPLESALNFITPCLVVSEEDWNSYNMHSRLSEIKKVQVLKVQAFQNKDEPHTPETVKKYTLTEKEVKEIEKEVGSAAAVVLEQLKNVYQPYYKGLAPFTAEYIVASLSKDNPAFSFFETPAERLFMVESRFLKEPNFFSFLEPGIVSIDDDLQEIEEAKILLLKNSADFLNRLGDSNPSPLLAPLSAKVIATFKNPTNRFFYVPSEQHPSWNEYFESLDDVQQRNVVKYKDFPVLYNKLEEEGEKTEQVRQKPLGAITASVKNILGNLMGRE